MELYVQVNDAAGCRWGRRWARVGSVSGMRHWDLAADEGGGSFASWSVAPATGGEDEVLARFLEALSRDPEARGWVQERPSGLPGPRLRVQLRSATPHDSGLAPGLGGRRIDVVVAIVGERT